MILNRVRSIISKEKEKFKNLIKISKTSNYLAILIQKTQKIISLNKDIHLTSLSYPLRTTGTTTMTTIGTITASATAKRTTRKSSASTSTSTTYARPLNAEPPPTTTRRLEVNRVSNKNSNKKIKNSTKISKIMRKIISKMPPNTF